ncbi:MAG TPA: zf-HC2 domain-containing protein [Candidatus Omnitrophota bacterium]|nr:zf-HC2 domain-containing protein [Candidatus Omnitrophota bacterium]HRZ14171.1 zf-HC2 domain-containing protein [Candidatus Omnitrophota bacterium]
MSDKLEEVIRMAHKHWLNGHKHEDESHPDEEMFVGFLAGELSTQDQASFKEHIGACSRCSEHLSAAIALSAVAPELEEVPAEVLERARKQIYQHLGASVLEIAVLLKDAALELLYTTGDLLFGQELIPGATLRSRNVGDFKEEVVLFKDFKDIRLEVKVEHKAGQICTLSVLIREKNTQKPINDCRVTLIKDELEMESKLADTAKAVFENIPPGMYSVEITSPKQQLASIIADIRV